jgi:hypothetical protein
VSLVRPTVETGTEATKFDERVARRIGRGSRLDQDTTCGTDSIGRTIR